MLELSFNNLWNKFNHFISSISFQEQTISLPKEVTIIVLSYLNWNDFKNAKEVCKLWQQVVNEAANLQQRRQIFEFNNAVNNLQEFAFSSFKQYLLLEKNQNNKLMDINELKAERANLQSIIKKFLTVLHIDCTALELLDLSSDLSDRNLFKIALIMKDLYMDVESVDDNMLEKNWLFGTYGIDAKSPNNDRIILSNGSVWIVNPAHVRMTSKWTPENCKLNIVPNHVLNSHYRYILTNNFSCVEVNLLNALNKTELNSICRIDSKRGLIQLADTSIWRVPQEQCKQLLDWKTYGCNGTFVAFAGDAIAIGFNREAHDKIIHTGKILTNIIININNENHVTAMLCAKNFKWIENCTEIKRNFSQRLLEYAAKETDSESSSEEDIYYSKAMELMDSGSTLLYKKQVSDYEIQIWDGSCWTLNPEDLAIAKEWKHGDEIIILPSMNERNLYKFELGNKSTKQRVEANVTLRSESNNPLSRSISEFKKSYDNALTSVIVLSDGSQWIVEGRPPRDWEGGDSVCVGIDRKTYANILVNQDLCSWIRAQKK